LSFSPSPVATHGDLEPSTKYAKDIIVFLLESQSLSASDSRERVGSK